MTARVLGRRGWKGALTAFVAAVLMFTGIGAASAAPTAGTGSVSGTVMRAADGTPAAGVTVHVVLQDFSAGESATTAPDGTFTIDGLAPGTYLVSFAQGSDDYVMQWWRGAATQLQSTAVAVQADQAITGIDASLASAGQLSGTVTRAADGSGAAGIQVSASSWGGGAYSATTDSTGAYRITGMAPGSYSVAFLDPGNQLLLQWWKNAATQMQAQLAVVNADAETMGIDAAMAVSVTISGRVLAASDASPVTGSVSATGPAGSFVGAIGSDGSYTLHVSPGTYTVHFQPYDGNLLGEYWQHAATMTAATPVTVAVGEDATGIDADLAQAVFISGTVRLNGAPFSDAVIEAWANGSRVNTAWVQQDGTYRLQVPTGTYTLVAKPGEHATTQTQYYDHVLTEAEATPVTVADVAGRAGIDFDLLPIQAPVSLSVGSAHPGDSVTVTSSGFTPGEHVTISLHSTPVALATVDADLHGSISAMVTIPADAVVGAHEIVLTGAASKISGSAAFAVVAASGPGGSGGSGGPGGSGGAVGSSNGAASAGAESSPASDTTALAATGAEAPDLALGLAALMLLAGLALVRVRRRAGCVS